MPKGLKLVPFKTDPQFQRSLCRCNRSFTKRSHQVPDQACTMTPLQLMLFFS